MLFILSYYKWKHFLQEVCVLKYSSYTLGFCCYLIVFVYTKIYVADLIRYYNCPLL
jgi:hypothetical protein